MTDTVVTSPAPRHARHGFGRGTGHCASCPTRALAVLCPFGPHGPHSWAFTKYNFGIIHTVHVLFHHSVTVVVSAVSQLCDGRLRALRNEHLTSALPRSSSTQPCRWLFVVQIFPPGVIILLSMLQWKPTVWGGLHFTVEYLPVAEVLVTGDSALKVEVITNSSLGKWGHSPPGYFTTAHSTVSSASSASSTSSSNSYDKSHSPNIEVPFRTLKTSPHSSRSNFSASPQHFNCRTWHLLGSKPLPGFRSTSQSSFEGSSHSSLSKTQNMVLAFVLPTTVRVP
ncbi:hypothetical protein VFPFJ_11507 [Purpureocillium lilacinum]|uniref:Uncharacterized protein n=1 Tax=Purpureocillium lilacinum TaxID=33203 RepID=A0A179F4T3_PURLI|nr:hypothetical protein VFPFJ_11507 [Purpureocillium lilacinum]OAQ60412.1 hypothetical protein VFPFJ_11507 [Purpureocillium lilacinum]